MGVFTMAKQLDTLISKLDYNELLAAQKLIDEQKEQHKQQDFESLRAEFAHFVAKVEERGHSIEKVTKMIKKPRLSKATKPKGEPKFRNPANSSQTWAGHGRKPDWLLKQLEAGKNVEDFAV
jgi:DNA-binding protein H-NS